MLPCNPPIFNHIPKTVLISGANRGLGLEFVRQFANATQPPQIIVAGCRDPSGAADLKALAEGAKEKSAVHVIALDLSSDESIATAAEATDEIVGKHGLNLLIGNAGVLARGAQLGALKRDMLQSSFDVNATGQILLVQALSDLILKASRANDSLPMCAGRAGVINISTRVASMSNKLTSGRSMAGYAYRMSKTANNIAMKCLSVDLNNDENSPVFCASITPGHVRTRMTGFKGELTVEQSVAAMIDSILKFGKEENGGYFDRLGTTFSW